MAKLRRNQPLLIRITHVLQLPAFAILLASGLQIWSAYPYFGPRGATYDALPWQGYEWPSVLRAGGWLGGARGMHLTWAWVFVGCGVVYVGYLAVTREWRRRFATAAIYRRPLRILYASAIGLAAVLVASGFALWKPVQLHWLATPMGGYDGARVVHYYATVAALGFVVVHVVLVAIALVRAPRRVAEIVTGGAPTEVP